MKKHWYQQLLSIALVLALLVQLLPIQVLSANSLATPLTQETLPTQTNTYTEGDAPPVTVVGEEESLRTETEKHFRMSDGSYMAVAYGMPVHYQDESGAWQDIDNTLESSQGGYSTNNANVATTFSANLSGGTLFSTSYGETSVSIALANVVQTGVSTASQLSMSAAQNAQTSFNSAVVADISVETESLLNANISGRGWTVEDVIPESLQASILYEDVYSGVDLLYTAFGYNIKEQIIVNEPQAAYRYAFRLELDGVSAELNDDGSVSLLDANDEVIYYIPAPFMEDANGVVSYEVSYSISSVAGGILLSVEADAAWMNDEERAYPVAIDPTVEVQVSNHEEIDTSYIVQGNPNYANYNAPYFRLGYTENLNAQEHRGFVHFNALPELPFGAVITEALFNMYLYSYEYSNENMTELAIGAYEVTEDMPDTMSSYGTWLDSLTWDTMPAYDTSNMIDYVRASNSMSGTTCSWDLTELVKKWYDEGTENRTIAMTMVGSTCSDTNWAILTFGGRSSNYPPIFMVSYRNLLGVKDYYSYATLGVADAGTVYLSDYTGQMTVVKELLSYASATNPFSLNLVYNSALYADYPAEMIEYTMCMGAGWNLNMVQKVEPDSIGDEVYLRYYDGDGTIHYFVKDEADSTGTIYYDEDGLGLTIEQTGTANYTLSDMSGNRYFFTDHMLTSIEDEDGNQYIIHMTLGKITSITQKNNGATAETTVAAFSYSGYRLLTVTDATGAVYTLNYEDDKLRTIYMGTELIAEYMYEGARLTNVLDGNTGYSIAVTYDDGGRISHYAEYDIDGFSGAQVAVQHSEMDKTTYQDYGNDRVKDSDDDIFTHYLFDNYGRTVNAYTMDADGDILGADNAVYYDGGTADRRNNRTVRTASIGTVSTQFMYNCGFEDVSTPYWTLSGEVSFSADNPRTGNQSLKFTGSDAKTVSQTWRMFAGQTFTFSCYMNSSEMTSVPASGIYLSVTDPDGNSTNSHYLDYQTSDAVDNGWTRLSITFTAEVEDTYTFSICSTGGAGTLYVDDAVLEEECAPSVRNLVENSDFNGMFYGWTFPSGCYPSTTQGFGGGMAGVISGTLTSAAAKITQNVPINLSGSETYVLSGWAKANAVPDNVLLADSEKQDTEKSFGLRAVVNYADDTKEYFYVPFNPDVAEWQYVSMSIAPGEATKTVASITVECAYERNANMARFDKISLVRETVQSMSYDDEGNCTSVSVTGITSDTSTYANGNLTELETGTGSTYSFAYDETYAHRLLSYTDGATTQSMTYDGVGNVTSSVFSVKSDEEDSSAQTGLSLQSANIYSENGNLLDSSTDTSNISVAYQYSTAISKMLGAPTAVTDANNTVTDILYDNLGRTTQASVANHATVLYNYSGDNLTGIIRQIADRENMNYYMQYDSFGNMTAFIVNQTPIITYEYGSSNGQLTKQTYRNGGSVSYTYDNLGRVATETYSDGRVVTYTYNGEGQLYSVNETGGDAPATYLYTYDSTGNLVASEKKNANGSTAMRVYQDYDAAGQLVGQTWCLGSSSYSESYTYNPSNGTLSSMVTGMGQTLQLGYDELQRLTSVGNGLYTKNYSYRNISDTRTTTQVSQVQYTGLSTDISYGYTYDAVGNIATYSAPGKSTVTYTYDALGQLLSAVGDETYTYTYDSAGNVLTANGHTYTYGAPGWPDLLSGYDGETIVFDRIGNPLSYYNGTRWTFTWKNGRSLATATDGDTNLSFGYDANGLRTTKTVDGVAHKYYYASGQLMRETYGNRTLDFFYDAGGYPYGLKTNEGFFLYITNLQGDVTHLINVAGNIVASYEYDPYGNIVSATGTMADINPLRYRGYYYDSELEMYYLQSRYYDPQIGRFLNMDAYASTGQGILGCNMFAYCNNNPSSMVDIDGECCTFAIRIFFVKISKTIDCGRKTCPTSKSYVKPRVAVISDGLYSGTLFSNDGKGFKHQGQELVKRLSKTNTVTSYFYTSMGGFVDAWNSLSGRYDAVYIVAHGWAGGLSCAGESISAQGDEYSFSQLHAISTRRIYLYCCNGATPDYYGYSTAQYLSRITGASVVAVKDGKMNFSWYGCYPRAVRGGYWVTVYPSIYL